MSKELVTIEEISEEKAPTIYVKDGLKRFLDMTRAQVEGEVPDLSTRKGRDRIASLAATVSKSKTAVEKPGRDYLRRLKAMPKTVEEELRIFVTEMDALRDKVRQPLNEYEAAEVARKDAIEDAVQGIIDLSTVIEDATSADIEQQRANLQALIINEATYQERLEEAEEKRKYGIHVLTMAFDKCKAFEEQNELLERMRKEIEDRAEQDRIKAAQQQAVEDERQRVAQEQQAQREADARKLQEAEQATRDAEENARNESNRRRLAEQTAESERIATEQRELIAKDRAEQDALAAAALARKQEQQRQQNELAEQQRQKSAREADKAHRGLINKAALDALLTVNMSAPGQPESFLIAAEAQAIIVAIVRGQIPAISIAY